MALTVKETKNLTMRKEIYVDDNLIKTLSATIDSNTNDISFSTDYIQNMELYKANKVEIRRIEADFEDEAFAEQDKLTDENAPKEKVTKE
ncbi:hypothetical protein DWX89_03170 [Coprobacillus sp. AF21-8LB]|nr:hypothetical protein DWX89_03170 [Coprobacillus sp. AF21-8LB]